MNGISVIGLEKLGLCIAVCFADKGFKVIGVDVWQDFNRLYVFVVVRKI